MARKKRTSFSIECLGNSTTFWYQVLQRKIKWGMSEMFQDDTDKSNCVNSTLS